LRWTGHGNNIGENNAFAPNLRRTCVRTCAILHPGGRGDNIDEACKNLANASCPKKRVKSKEGAQGAKLAQLASELAPSCTVQTRQPVK